MEKVSTEVDRQSSVPNDQQPVIQNILILLLYVHALGITKDWPLLSISITTIDKQISVFQYDWMQNLKEFF